MGELEELARERIRELYGSIPKMAEAVGMPPTTIYHALDRGLDNTRTETSNKIKECLLGNPLKEGERVLSSGEERLLALFRGSSETGREHLLRIAEDLADAFPMEQR